MDIELILPDEIFEALLASNSPSAANPIATIADLGAAVNTIYSADDTVGSGRTLTITDTLTFTGGTVIDTYSNAGRTITNGTGQNPIGFGSFGTLSLLETTGQFDQFFGNYEFGGNPIYDMQIYDSATFVEKVSHYSAVQNFSGTDRPYGGIYYTSDGVNFTGIEANVNGTRVLDQNPLNRLSSLSGPDGIAFLSGVGGQGYIGTADQAGFASWIGTTLDQDTFYTADGSITGDRTVTGDESTWTFDNTDFHVETGDGAFIDLQGDVITINSPVGLAVQSDIDFTEGVDREIRIQDSTGIAGYNLTIAAGGGGAGLGSGGNLILEPGAGGTGGPGGSPGDILLQGLSTTGGAATGTTISLVAGNSAGNTGGDLVFTTGNGGGPGAGGNFTITTGTGTARGTIVFADGSEGTIGDVWTSTGVNGEGTWSALTVTDSGETYIVSNDNTVRTIDANNINGATLRDLVATLIRDLNTAGVLTV